MRVKSGLAEMLKGGVIMDVTTAEQARIAEDAGAVAVMALERVPADIRARGRRRAHGRPDEDPRDPGGRDDPGHGEGADRPLRRGADPRGARGRLHRRERGADARRRGAPHRQVGVPRPVRVRLPQPRRGAAAHQRGRRDDPHEGRGRHRRHRQRGAPHARRLRRHPAARRRCRGGALRGGEGARARRSSSCSGSPSTDGCRSSRSPPAGSRRPPTPRSACSSAPTASSSARASSRARSPPTRAKAIVEATTHFRDAEILARVSPGSGRRCAGSPRRHRAGRAARNPRLVVTKTASRVHTIP